MGRGIILRVLVTSSRNTFALDIIRKLGSTGHTVVASDTYAGAIGSHSKYLEAHAVTASPRFKTDQFIADISELVTKHNIDLIIPSFEEAFYLSARVHDLPAGVTLFAGDFESLARLHDKASFQRLAEQAGVPIPETLVVTNTDELNAAIARYPRYFARAAFSRGGVGLLTNTGPLAGKMQPEDCHPTVDQPWLVQPFVDGPMVCTYSTIVKGRVTAHCTYRAPEQWAHSTGIDFLAIDSTDTLAYTEKLVGELDPNFTGQLSFDFVDHEGGLKAIECNPRSTNGVILIEADALAAALEGTNETTVVVEPGVERQVSLAVLADAFTEPIKHLPTSLHDLIKVRDIGAGWHDSIAMMWSPATLIHGAKMAHGKRQEILGALGEDIVWNGEEIDGMSESDAAALEAVHGQRV
ncbi:glutathione synthase/RimK-type ligase-like ATP-grasp enzyme [Leucobacter exalbidus]|uniref:Glutathione synthase/RimK-type ligase-like ATP-grasp enzyme n=1 Tax=Leucobacter exalbidus TaxID=662960 RepID=A0A940PWH6_9MICO|nr:carbamoyl-phosphate synthase large subunit [Leucobacter exalbidus]MBP1326604.1 glutathione synthase/RimK-type ligase-like ATP-grasp enzyme [Leucobacter exalbidus]